MVDFEKNGAKLSLMMFLTTFVPKKIGNVFANVDFHVNPHFAALCATHQFLTLFASLSLSLYYENKYRRCFATSTKVEELSVKPIVQNSNYRFFRRDDSKLILRDGKHR